MPLITTVSKLIDKLAKAGYGTTDLSMLLYDLNIPEDASHIFTLLTTYDIATFKDILMQLDVERALIICDELGASQIINNIMNMLPKLEYIMTSQIINNNVCDHTLLTAYRYGYRLLPNNLTIDNTYLPLSEQQNLINNSSVPYINELVLTLPYPQLTSVTMKNIKKISYEKLTDGALRMLSALDTVEDIYVRDSYYCDFYKGCRDNFADFCFPRSVGVLHVPDITDRNIALCVGLRELYAYGCEYVTTCTPFAKSLRILDASERCGISDIGLRQCTHIKKLYACNNNRITTCKPFAKSLKVVDASFACGITNFGLTMCKNIKHLVACNNSRITTCVPFANTIRTLDASYVYPAPSIKPSHNISRTTTRDTPDTVPTCGITNASIIMCPNLKVVKAHGNKNVTIPYQYRKIE